MKIAPAGDRGLLVTLRDVSAAELHAARAAVRMLPDVLACVPGHSSLLIVGKPSVEAVRNAIGNASDVAFAGREHRVRVALDGEDLPEFLATRRPGFPERLEGMRLTARYLGFRGGFAYLDGWPAEWAMPRRKTSRPVKRGAFAIAGNVAAFYPLDTPGGWNVLGRTDHPLEFAAGDEIVIEVVEAIENRVVTPRRDALVLEGVEIVSAPLAVVVKDEDWARVERGFSPGGPFDPEAAALAKHAAGSRGPVLECAMVWPKLRTSRRLAFVGPDGVAREHAEGRIEGGLRGYVAAGDEWRGGALQRGDAHVIRAIAGPHDVGIRDIECEVTPQLDRVGIRLRPLQTIDAGIPADLPSCGMQCGTLQLHPDGSVVAMGPDHPVTGGYLQPMTVVTSERWKLARLVPGERVRFVAVQSPNA